MTEVVQYVITLTASDRPGIVDKVAETVARFHGNWLESTMTRLAGQFAGITLVSLPANEADAFLQAVNALGTEGINASCERCDAGAASTHNVNAITDGNLQQIELVGSDRPGIVKQLSELLKTLNVNVERIETSRQAGSMSGSPLFTAKALISLPQELPSNTLAERLEVLSSDLQVSLESL
ncbi:MAG: glycine cleavage system protein R [Lysobacterales bacterium]